MHALHLLAHAALAPLRPFREQGKVVRLAQSLLARHEHIAGTHLQHRRGAQADLEFCPRGRAERVQHVHAVAGHAVNCLVMPRIMLQAELL
eukprot:CAMPEP_0177628510 /NCGR_PEP_ID=MMETSP0447-20121125/170_1 /TAXON_ID=0 /ORGANISM="Stygamoeba regulata, Strain BSH-02190019" /LENGTH=90 /DNA_ID=CAMNT_0019129763 /DNA_START=622 /DNA_END=894 /DNA_ORIENTATION=-